MWLLIFFTSGRESESHRIASPQSRLMCMLRVGVHEKLRGADMKSGAHPCMLCLIPLSCYLVTPFSVHREFSLSHFEITRSDIDP